MVGRGRDGRGGGATATGALCRSLCRQSPLAIRPSLQACNVAHSDDTCTLNCLYRDQAPLDAPGDRREALPGGLLFPPLPSPTHTLLYV